MTANAAVRRGTVVDLDAVHDVRRRAILGMDCDWFPEVDRRAWAYKRERDYWLPRIAQGTVVIAELDGVPVAWGSSQDDRVTAMYTEPDSCRKGIGRLLLSQLESDILERGYGVALLLAASNAVAFYERVGYLAAEPVRFDGPTEMSKHLARDLSRTD